MVDCLRRIEPHLVHAHIAGEYAQAADQSSYPYLLTQEFRHLIKGKVYDISNPVKQAFFDLDSPGHEGRLLFVGNACPRKGFVILLRALARVKDAHLHVAGFVDRDARFSQEVNEALNTDGLRNRVKFRGSLNEQDLLQEYDESSIFVLPSIQETAPVALLQAMAAGKPSVVSRVGGHPYLIRHGHTGLLVEPGDVGQLSQALGQLLRDRNAQRQMGEQSRREALESFQVSRLAEKTLAVYQEVALSNCRGN